VCEGNGRITHTTLNDKNETLGKDLLNRTYFIWSVGYLTLAAFHNSPQIKLMHFWGEMDV
jgi:hypothetical protein